MLALPALPPGPLGELRYLVAQHEAGAIDDAEYVLSLVVYYLIWKRQTTRYDATIQELQAYLEAGGGDLSEEAQKALAENLSTFILNLWRLT